MTILVLKGRSRNNVLTRMAEQLSAAFTLIGAPSRMLEVEHADIEAKLAAALGEGDVDTVVSFAAFGAELKGPRGGSLYDEAAVRFVGWTVDHPCYQYARAMAPITDRLTVCATDHHFAFMDYMGAGGGRLPLLPAAAQVGPPKPFAARPIPILVAMSFMGAPERWWEAARGTPVQAIAEGVIDRVMADPAADIGSAYRRTLDALGYAIDFDANFATILGETLTYVRRLDRMRLLQALGDSGLPVTLCGAGWEPFTQGYGNIDLVGERDFDALSRLYGDSRIVINLNAGNGGGERAVSAMAAGAAVVSDHGGLLDRAFSPGAIRFFDRTRPDGIAGVIGALLESGDGEGLGAAGHRLIEQGHLWRHRAEAILAYRAPDAKHDPSQGAT